MVASCLYCLWEVPSVIGIRRTELLNPLEASAKIHLGQEYIWTACRLQHVGANLCAIGKPACHIKRAVRCQTYVRPSITTYSPCSCGPLPLMVCGQAIPCHQ